MLKKIIISLFVFALIVVSSIALIGKKEVGTYGSVTIGNEYHSTTTNSTWNTTNMKMITNCTNALGTVLITNATAGAVFEIRDATSTTDVSSTSIVTFPSAALGGEYSFDTALIRNGMAIITTSGNAASTTITCR